jgi:hypothetical protein
LACGNESGGSEEPPSMACRQIPLFFSVGSSGYNCDKTCYGKNYSEQDNFG